MLLIINSKNRRKLCTRRKKCTAFIRLEKPFLLLNESVSKTHQQCQVKCGTTIIETLSFSKVNEKLNDVLWNSSHQWNPKLHFLSRENIFKDSVTFAIYESATFIHYSIDVLLGKLCRWIILLKLIFLWIFKLFLFDRRQSICTSVSLWW